MKKCCIYKLKENKRLNVIDEDFTKFVYVEDFIRNPLEKDKSQCAFRYIYEDDLEYVNLLMGLYYLPCDVFDEYFELYMEVGEINQRIEELEKGKEIK